VRGLTERKNKRGVVDSRAPRGEKDRGAWWVLAPARACGRRGRAAVCPAWQRGSRGGVRPGWLRLAHCHGPAQAHSAVFYLKKDF
jgi:hypothetical protein